MYGISIILTFCVALYFPGMIALTKAKFGGRKGAGIFQPTRDILRLFKKGSVYSHTTSFVFKIAPIIYLSCILLAMLFVPLKGTESIFSFHGDFIFFMYVLALGKFFMIIAALDTGSGFEGMGANREALYSMLVEPALFICLGTLALLTGNTSFAALYSQVQADSYLSYLLIGLIIYLIIQISMVENSRIPVDDPKTHLELTMIHEVMVLDYSGFDLGLIQWANVLKFTVFGSLIANFFTSDYLNIVSNIVIVIGCQLGFAIIIGLLESFRARRKMARNPQWIIALSSIALIAFFTALIYTHKFIID